MPRRVPRAMHHVEHTIADRDGIAIVQPSGGFEHFSIDAVFAAIVVQPRDPEPVRLFRAFDRHTQFAGKDAGAAAMVDMAVGHQQLFNRHPGLGDGLSQQRQIAAGIDKRAAHGFGAPHQRAILLQGGDGNDRHFERRYGWCLRFGHAVKMMRQCTKRNPFRSGRLSTPPCPPPPRPGARGRYWHRRGCR